MRAGFGDSYDTLNAAKALSLACLVDERPVLATVHFGRVGKDEVDCVIGNYQLIFSLYLPKVGKDARFPMGD